MTKTIEERAEELIQTLVVAGDMMFHEGADRVRTRRVVELALIEQAREDARIAQKLSDDGAPISESIEEGRGWDRGAAAAAQAILAQLQQGGKT